MIEHYLDRLANTIRENWDQPALTDFYLNEDGTAQDLTRGHRYTYGGMYQEIVRVANLLIGLGLQKGDHIAICGANSAHWVIAYLAIAKLQGVSVTVMHSLMPEDIARQIDFSDAKALFTDEETWAELKDQSLPQVEHVISLEEWEVLCGEKQIINLKFETLNQDCQFPPVESDNLAMICFTSGSTGTAKGVMLSSQNIGSTIECVAETYPARKNKNVLSYFPMAHAFGLGLEIMVPITSGYSIYVYRGDLRMDKLQKAMLLVKPYLALMVPIMLTKIAEKSLLKLLLLHFTRIENFVIGGAGLPYRIAEFMKRTRIPIAPGYGMTETVALISLCTPKTYKVGSSGKICKALTCRISNEGEILVKGDNVMLGYYKDREATVKKIDAEGWLHTGDKGHLDEDGYLYVEGRLNQDMIVLPNGENINPEEIENKINTLPEVKESIVLERDGHLVAIVVPSSLPFREKSEVGSLRRHILRAINPELPLFCQLYDLELTDQPLARTEKQTLKRYLYK